MSMLCTLSRVTPSQIEAMRGDPSVAGQLLHEAQPIAPARPGVFARLLGRVPPPPARLVPWIGAAQQYDLDGQWHILHFLLTGESEGGAFPASFLCGDSEEVGADLGYGKPRLFTSEQASQIADYLHSIAEAELFARYDAGEIEERGVYWQVAPSEEEQRAQVRDLHETMMQVADFAADTARRGWGLVIEVY